MSAHYVYDETGGCWSSAFPMTAPRITARQMRPSPWWRNLLNLFGA